MVLHFLLLKVVTPSQQQLTIVVPEMANFLVVRLVRSLNLGLIQLKAFNGSGPRSLILNNLIYCQLHIVQFSLLLIHRWLRFPEYTIHECLLLLLVLVEDAADT